VTAIQADRVFLCGHPFLNLGDVQMPMARSRVLTTLSSNMASTKNRECGRADRNNYRRSFDGGDRKAWRGTGNDSMELTTKSALGEKTIHAQIVNHPKLTPLLVALTAFNGLTQNVVYGEGTTLKLNAEIRLKGHAPVEIEKYFLLREIR